jgi:hypothetical protein
MAAKKTGKPSSTTSSVANSISVLVHGTFSKDIGRWHRPGSRFHRYIKGCYFPDVYSEEDFFYWTGGKTDKARIDAAHKLIDWCEKHPAKKYNFISHSHGTNVVNLATNNGLTNVNKLIHLSPPVWSDKDGYLPNMDVVEDKTIYNIRPRFDLIVTVLAKAQQNYDATPTDRYEMEITLPLPGHWAPLDVRNWERFDIGEIVTSQMF